MGLRELLATPFVALILGALVGLLLLLPVLLGYRFLGAERIDLGIGVTTGGVFVGMLVAVGALFGYRALAEEGLVYFGPALIGGFVIGLVVFALRVAKTMLESDKKARS